MQHVRLVRLHAQALGETGERLGVLLLRFENASEAVQREQADRPFVGIVGGRMVGDPGPFGDGRVGLTEPVVHRAEVEARLDERRRQRDGLEISVFRAFEFADIRQRRTQVEVREMIEGRLIAREPRLIQHGGQFVLLSRFELARAVQQVVDAELLLPGQQHV